MIGAALIGAGVFGPADWLVRSIHSYISHGLGLLVESVCPPSRPAGSPGFDPKQDVCRISQRQPGAGGNPRQRGNNGRTEAALGRVCVNYLSFLRFKGNVVARGGVFSSVFRGLFWPFGVVVRVAATG